MCSKRVLVIYGLALHIKIILELNPLEGNLYNISNIRDVINVRPQ